MNEMQQVEHMPTEIFNFDGIEVRTATIQGDPWFVASDVSRALDYRDAEKLTRMLDDEEKCTLIVGTLGGAQEMLAINESGLYSSILRSRKPEAKRFKTWVTSVLLPGIRRREFVHVSEVPTTEGVLAQLLSSYEALRADIAEIKSSVNTKTSLPQVEGPASVLSKDEAARRGLMTTAKLAKTVGVSTSRMNALLDVLGFHERKQGRYEVTKKAKSVIEVVSCLAGKSGKVVEKHLWKTSLIGKLPKELLGSK